MLVHSKAMESGRTFKPFLGFLENYIRNPLAFLEMKWREEILRYFKTSLTNARIEGINRKLKLLQRCAFGLQNFENYRLRALYSCS